MTTVLFVAFPQITQLDMTGPAQFLSRLPGATTLVAAETLNPVMTDAGFAIAPSVTFADAPRADILCVPGGHGVVDAVANRTLLDFVAAQAESAKWITSVCTGAFVLGKAGLLEGKRATTHWAYAHLLPLVGARHEPARVVEDGHTVTAGGVTAGIDFALTLIAREAGEATARAIQLALEYDPLPPFMAGTPATAEPRTIQFLKDKVYNDAAARMAAALGGEAD